MSDYRRGGEKSTGINRQIASENGMARCKLCGYTTCRCAAIEAPNTAEIVERAKASAREIRIEPGVPVRVIERDGKVIWSKVDDQMRDLTEENSDGLLYHVGSLFAPYGEANAIETLTAENERMRAHIAKQIEHAETRIRDGDEHGASIWRIALGDIARENRQALSNTRGRG